ncbi:MAG: transposase [Acidobacteria bacterium]|nr:transposase [Acidobacteriota bacterium]
MSQYLADGWSGPSSFPHALLNRELQDWEQTYNTVRRHQALGYLTPLEFLALSSPQRKNPSVTNPLDEFSKLTRKEGFVRFSKGSRMTALGKKQPSMPPHKRSFE